MGVTEPQMRRALHLGALLGIVGCHDLEELCLRGDIAKTFVAMLQYVASITFRSPETFAAHCQTENAGKDNEAAHALFSSGI